MGQAEAAFLADELVARQQQQIEDMLLVFAVVLLLLLNLVLEDAFLDDAEFALAEGRFSLEVGHHCMHTTIQPQLENHNKQASK